jgi:HAD superfamily hydrolase (TIGR01509 family)
VIRALVFDFDGLILDTETPLIDAYGDVHAAHGKPFDRADFLRGVGHVDFTFNPWRAFGPEVDEAALEAQRQVHNRDRTLAQPLLPGVTALLDAARAAGLQLAVASNSSHNHVEGHLKRLGLHAHFEFFACRGDAPSPKPEPDLYRLVLQKFGLRGVEAIAFEDSQTGSLAAKRANLWTVAVPNESTAHHDFGHADLRVKSLAEVSLPELVARYSSSDQRA